MTADKRRGLGRGLGALIPTAPPRPETEERPAAPSPPPAPVPAGASDGRDPVSQWVVGSAAPAPAGPAARAGQGDLAPVEGAYFAELPINAISPNPKQPRTVFDEDAMAEPQPNV